MVLIMKSTLKTSGTHKQYKPGQLLTIGKDIVRVSKYKKQPGCAGCYTYGICIIPCAKCFRGEIPNHCILKLVKHKG